MTMPADLPGQVAHVFPSSPQRDVLVRLASELETVKAVLKTCQLCQPPADEPQLVDVQVAEAAPEEEEVPGDLSDDERIDPLL